MNSLLNGTYKHFLLWDIFLEVVLPSMFTEIFDTCNQMALQKYCTVHTFGESSRMLSAAKEPQSQHKMALRIKTFIFSHKPELQLKGTIYTVSTQLHFFWKTQVGNHQTNCMLTVWKIMAWNTWIPFWNWRQEASWANSDLGTGELRSIISSTRTSKAHCSQALPSLDITQLPSPCQSNKWIISFKISSVKQMSWASSIV